MNEEKLRAALHDCRNEMCIICGKYKESHLGACDNCKWRFDGAWSEL